MNPTNKEAIDVEGGARVAFDVAGQFNSSLTTIVVRQPVDTILANAREIADGLISSLLIESAQTLPEVLAFFEMKNRVQPIDIEIERLSIEGSGLDLKKRAAINDATMAPMDLVTTLAKIEADKKAVTKQIEDAKTAHAVLVLELDAAKSAAEAALKKHARESIAKLATAAREKCTTARQAVVNAEIVKLAAGIAVADRIKVLTSAGLLESRALQILDSPA